MRTKAHPTPVSIRALARLHRDGVKATRYIDGNSLMEWLQFLIYQLPLGMVHRGQQEAHSPSLQKREKGPQRKDEQAYCHWLQRVLFFLTRIQRSYSLQPSCFWFQTDRMMVLSPDTLCGSGTKTALVLKTVLIEIRT